MTIVPTMAMQRVDANGLKLFDPEGAVGNQLGQAVLGGGIGGLELAADVGQVVRQVRVGLGAGQKAGQQRAEGAADGVHAEGVQRVVVARPRT